MAKASPADMWHYREGGAPTEDIAGFSSRPGTGDRKGRCGKRRDGNRPSARHDGTVDLRQNRDAAAGVIERIDYKHRTVHVNRDMDDIKNAPEYDDARPDDGTYRSGLGDYYTASTLRIPWIVDGGLAWGYFPSRQSG